MEIDVTIERIDNGFIVSGKGVSNGKRYYKTLEQFAMICIVGNMRETDNLMKHQEIPDEPFYFKLSSDL